MKILNAKQLKAADAFTIAHEPVAAIDLMERAAEACVNWLLQRNITSNQIQVFCGKGGNGGDGLAMARMLVHKERNVAVFILDTGRKGTPEFETNLERLQKLPVPVSYLQWESQFPELLPDSLIIDALFGFGLNQPLAGVSAALVQHVNACGAEIVSIDLPSGLFADVSSKGNVFIQATYTLTFECYKLALLMAENASAIGEVHVLPISLHPDFLQSLDAGFETIDDALIKTIFKPRNRFAHKGTFGHALLIGGSYGKIGAMVLATSACLRSGAGLVTAYIPQCGYTILQTTAPEAMTVADASETYLSQPPAELERFNAIGIGPGMGMERASVEMLHFIIKHFKKPMVLDADALNGLATQPEQLTQLFQNTILTPHPKEFERLFGSSVNDFERIRLATKKAAELHIVIVLKGHHTLVALPNGNAYFNTTGNAGMAKGGSGDVLTGIITALLAQGYTAAEAALLGVYLHGAAGDAAAEALSQEAMTAADLITQLSQAFLEMNRSIS